MGPTTVGLKIMDELADIFNLELLPVMITKIQLQGTAKELQQHLEAHLADGWIVAALAEFVPNKRIYSSQLFCITRLVCGWV